MLLPIFPYKQFCLILNSLRQNCDWREIIWDIAIRPVLNSPADNVNVKVKGAKIKQGEYFPVYSNTIYFHNHGEYSKAVSQSLHGIDTAVMNMNPLCDDICFLSLPPLSYFKLNQSTSPYTPLYEQLLVILIYYQYKALIKYSYL